MLPFGHFTTSPLYRHAAGGRSREQPSTCDPCFPSIFLPTKGFIVCTSDWITLESPSSPKYFSYSAFHLCAPRWFAILISGMCPLCIHVLHCLPLESFALGRLPFFLAKESGPHTVCSTYIYFWCSDVVSKLCIRNVSALLNKSWPLIDHLYRTGIMGESTYEICIYLSIGWPKMDNNRNPSKCSTELRKSPITMYPGPRMEVLD